MFKELFKKLIGAIPGIGDIFQLANSGVSFAKGLGEEKRQKRLMDYQDQINDANYQKELADKERLISEDREYNNASNTMARARQAGVSPLAALGVSSGNSISATVPDTGTVSQPNDNSAQHFGNAMQMLVSTQELKNARERLKFEKEESEQRAKREEAQAEKLKAEKVYQDIINSNIDEKLKEELNNLVAQGKVLEAERKLKEAQAVVTTDENARAWEKHPFYIELQKAEKNNYDQSARNYRAHAIGKEFETWYEKKFGARLSTGVNSVMDKLAYLVLGSPDAINQLVEDVGSVHEQATSLVEKMKEFGIDYLSDEALFGYAKSFINFVKENKIQFRTQR